MRQTMLLLLLLQLLLLIFASSSSHAALTESQKIELMRIHNHIRESVYPTAATMTFMTRNTRLEELAQRAADKCEFKHQYGEDYQGLGENIYLGGRTNMTEITLAWMTEKVGFIHGGICNKTLLQPLTTCGHYQQLIADTADEIGCGHKLCSEGNLVFCEYSTGKRDQPYVAGPPCSRCPSTRSMCINGLCVNSSIVNGADASQYFTQQARDAAECKLQCMNCGNLMSVTSPKSCGCICDASVATGTVCEKNITNTAPSCSKCAAAGTACLNGGIDSGSRETCKCNCRLGFLGDRCQVEDSNYQSAVRIMLLRNQRFCAFTHCFPPPVSRTFLQSTIWQHLQESVAAAVNAECGRNSQNAAACCGGAATAAATGGSANFVTNSTVQLIHFELLPADDEKLSLVIFINLTNNANACTTPDGNRNIPREQLMAALQSNNASINSDLSGCCGVSMAVTELYSDYAKREYNAISGSSPLPQSAAQLLPQFLYSLLPALMLQLFLWNLIG